MASRVSPRWPRTLRARLAAEYAGYASERAFLTAVSDGTMPPPFTLDGANAWDLADLDTSIDAIKAGAQKPRRWQERAPARV
jgi:hypothetical protein